jgi:hypothetical protein
MCKVGAVFLGMSLLTLGGCAKYPEVTDAPTGNAKRTEAANKVDVGTTKSDVLRILGRPRNWASILPNGQLTITTVYSIDSIQRPMPAGETWLFEYVRQDGTKFCLHLSGEVVTKVVEGALLKDDSYQSRQVERESGS